LTVTVYNKSYRIVHMSRFFRLASGFSVLCATVLCSCVVPAADAVSWTGQVVDARTGASLAGMSCIGGGAGRVDLTPRVASDADGHFTVIYDHPLDLGFWQYYAIDVTDPEGRYFHYRRAQVNPEPLTIRLVPKEGYIQGVVRDAASGAALAGVEVRLGRTGRYLDSTTTDASGRFSFHVSAYDGSNNNETIPPEEQIYTDELVEPVTNYWLEATANGYRRLRTSSLGFRIPIRSSITDAIHTSGPWSRAGRCAGRHGASFGRAGRSPPRANRQQHPVERRGRRSR